MYFQSTTKKSITTLLCLCLPFSDVAYMCQKSAEWRLVKRLNNFGSRFLSKMCFPHIWQLALAQLTSQSARCQKECVKRFGGTTAPSTANEVKELRSATRT